MRCRRRIALACLFAVLVCPGVCLADAAEDLARSLAELFHGNVVEAPDAVPCDGFQTGYRVDVHAPVLIDRAGPGEALLPLVLAGAVAGGLAPPSCVAPLPTWPSPTAVRRQAWLQWFRC